MSSDREKYRAELCIWFTITVYKREKKHIIVHAVHAQKVFSLTGNKERSLTFFFPLNYVNKLILQINNYKLILLFSLKGKNIYTETIISRNPPTDQSDLTTLPTICLIHFLQLWGSFQFPFLEKELNWVRLNCLGSNNQEMIENMLESGSIWQQRFML